MGRILKKTLKLFVILLLTGILVATALFIITEYYGDEIEQAMVEKVIQHLDVKINVDDIRFSAFQNFPFASVTFTNVTTESGQGFENGPLIKAREVSILFNLYSLVSKQYTVDRLLIKDGFVNLMVGRDGSRNFDIFKNNSNDKSDQTTFQLAKVILKNIDVSYLHFPSNQEYLFKIPNGHLSGDFTSRDIKIGFDGNILTDYIRSGKTTLLAGKDLEMKLKLNLAEEGKKVVFNETKIKTDGIILNLSGNIDLTQNNKFLALEIKAEPAPAQSFLKLVPEAFRQPIKNYQLSGLLNISAGINGQFSGNKLPAIQLNFNLQDGQFINTSSDFKADDLSLGGTFLNGSKRSASSYEIRLENIKGKIKGGDLNGNLQIINFQKPLVKADLIAEFDLAEIDSYFDIPKLSAISGKLAVDMSFSNQLQSFRQFTIHDFISSQTAGELTFRELQFALADNLLDFNQFNGSFQFNNKDLLIDQFTGKVSGSDFSMDGYFGNILAFAFVPDEPVYIKADFNSSHINLDELLAYSSNKDDAPYLLKFSKRVDFDLQVNIDNFKFRKFSGNKLQGHFSLADQKFVVSKGSIQTMKGMVTMDGNINGTNPHVYFVDCVANFSDVDIKQLFTAFGNFGQNNLTDHHLRGSATANVHYKSTLSPTLYVNPASVFTQTNITINNGELINYTPLFALSKYIKKEELEHVRFSTLENNIRIENEVIYVPNMEIKSSTMDISLFGTHTFDNMTDYHFQLYLADLLKNGKQQKAQEEIEGIFETDPESGKPKLFLSMTGPADNPEIKYDTKEVRKKIASDLNTEKEEFKKMMHQEFSWFSSKQNDTIQNRASSPADQKDFAIGFDEIKKDTSRVSKPAADKNQKKSKSPENTKANFIIEWDETRDTIR